MKLTRLRFLASLLSFPLLAKFVAKPKLAEGHEILRSFDARDWARHFVEDAKQIPGLATDEETMVTWFSNALMRGYDERSSECNRDAAAMGCLLIDQLTLYSVRGAVARGWCAEECGHKEMDGVLAEAISQEIMKLGSRKYSDAEKAFGMAYWQRPSGEKWPGLNRSGSVFDDTLG